MKLFKRIAVSAALLFAALGPVAAMAAPAPYVTTANDVPYVLINQAIQGINGTGGQFAGLAFGTASSNAATINSARLFYTTASLSTAAGALSTAQTVTDSAVVASSQVVCQVNAYSGTWATNGVPNVVAITPGAGSFTFQVWNGGASNALSGTVGVSCIVFN